jgi:hypothetical protein
MVLVSLFRKQLPGIIGNTESGIATECLRRQKPVGRTPVAALASPSVTTATYSMVDVGLASKF